MRIYGNRELKTLPGQLTRPTAAKVRTALFNIWRDIEGCSWLDLCAGNGSMGAEALGRGAKKVVGIEQSGKACAVIQRNWQKVAQSSQSFTVIRGHVLTQLGHWQGNPRLDALVRREQQAPVLLHCSHLSVQNVPLLSFTLHI